MFHVRHVDSLDLPELAPYRTMRMHHDHFQQRIFVAEGVKVVRRLLESNFAIVSTLMLEKWIPELESLLNARPEHLTAFIAPKTAMEQLVGFTLYQGVMAIGQFPAPIPLEKQLQNFAKPHLLVALDGLADAENMGVIVRNSVAFGVQVLISGGMGAGNWPMAITP